MILYFNSVPHHNIYVPLLITFPVISKILQAYFSHRREDSAMLKEILK
jgi:hypothetical protein